MNYNQHETRKKQKQLVSRANKNKRKISVSLFKSFLVCILLIVMVLIGAGLGAIKGILDNLPDVTADNLIPQGYQTVVYNQNGDEVTTLSTYDSNRVYAEFEDIPEDLRNAFIAIEDERFWEHNGIDVRGIGRAAFMLLQGEWQGASTITQQLIKNQIYNVGLDETTKLQTIERKIQEQYLAVELEKNMTKETILEYYLNTIYLGQGAYGVQAATEKYFGKEMKELTISECAVIASITQNPTGYDPVVYPEENIKRRQRTLDKMLELGFISQAEFDVAVADDVYTRIQSTYQAAEDAKDYNTYFIDAVISDLKERLINELEYTETQAYNAIYAGGLSIFITQDAALQGICNNMINDDENYPKGTSVGLEYILSISVRDEDSEDGITQIHYDSNKLLSYYKEKTGNSKYNLIYSSEETARAAADEFKEAMLQANSANDAKVVAENFKTTIQPQASFVLMDQHTGYVKAIVGGRGNKIGNLSLNRATMSTRQPGSTFKVLAAYVPALDAAGMSLATSYEDEPYNYANGRPVHNWYGGYRGLTTIRTAIKDSMNIIAVRTITDVDPQVSFEYLTNMGFTTLVESYTNSNGDIVSDINQSLALGGITNGVTNLELTAAYASIANNGTYVEPILYTKVLDHNGNILIDNTPEKKQVMKETTAWLLTDAMKDVVSSGTGTGARLRSGMPVAGKTGTTSNDYDFWFCGYTPYYTASIWMGYDVNTKFNNGYGYHKHLWAKIMNEIIEYENQSTSVSFQRPSGITSATVCKKSGMRPVEGVCTPVTEYFAVDTINSKPCDAHEAITLCKESQMPATDYCPETIDVVYEVDEKGNIEIEDAEELGIDIDPGKDFLKKKCDLHTKNTEYTITTSVIGEGGSITPSQTVKIGEKVVIKITPDPGYEIKDVVVDGESQGAIKKFTFKNVSKDHTITAKFKESKNKPDPEDTTEEEKTEEEKTEEEPDKSETGNPHMNSWFAIIAEFLQKLLMVMG